MPRLLSRVSLAKWKRAKTGRCDTGERGPVDRSKVEGEKMDDIQRRGVRFRDPFFEKHPGGNWLLNLAIGRDSTALLESYHLRPEVAVAGFACSRC